MRLVSVIIAVALATVPTFCATLADYPMMFIDDEQNFDGYLVVGRAAPAADTLALAGIALSLQDATSKPIPATVIKYDDEISAPFDKNIITVGSPCVNAVTARLLGNPIDCDAGLVDGKANIILLHEDHYYLIIAGPTANDDWIASAVVRDYENYNLSGMRMVYDTQTMTLYPTLFCGNGVCEQDESSSCNSNTGECGLGTCPQDCHSCTDDDGDGYGTDGSDSCTFSEIDCDDTTSEMHPLPLEIDHSMTSCPGEYGKASFKANDIVLDCNGATVSGDPAILVDGFGGNTIRNCRLTGGTGLEITSDDNDILKNYIYDNALGAKIEGKENLIRYNFFVSNEQNSIDPDNDIRLNFWSDDCGVLQQMFPDDRYEPFIWSNTVPGMCSNPDPVVPEFWTESNFDLDSLLLLSGITDDHCQFYVHSNGTYADLRIGENIIEQYMTVTVLDILHVQSDLYNGMICKIRVERNEACIDSDSDGFGNGVQSCHNQSLDCDDENNAVYPGATETCNNIDDDCDAQVDEDLTRSCSSGGCTGTQSCTAGAWSSCVTQKCGNNQYFSLAPARFKYSGYEGGCKISTEVVIANKTKVYANVTATSVEETVRSNCSRTEKRTTYYAYDSKLNVFAYGGSTTTGNSGGGWTAKRPKLMITSHPQVNDTWSDGTTRTKVVGKQISVNVPYGTFSNCLKTQEWKLTEPDRKTYRYYCTKLHTLVWQQSGKDYKKMIK